jgi:hypothetical protein
MRKIEFDTNGITGGCPISDIGLATSTNCQTCLYFHGFDGFDAKCAYDEPDTIELSRRMKIKRWIKNNLLTRNEKLGMFIIWVAGVGYGIGLLTPVWWVYLIVWLVTMFAVMIGVSMVFRHILALERQLKANK